MIGLLIETDVLLAVLNPADPVNKHARRVIGKDGLSLSPYTLLEINLLARAGKLEIPDYGRFAADLDALLAVNHMRRLVDRPQYHAEARRLERKFKLTFFDSLHAAVSQVERETIASFDRAYDGLEKEGLKRVDPRDA